MNLGWTPERFERLERGRRGGHDGPVERYGKKYQWIGLYEILGRIADKYKLRERWSDTERAMLEICGSAREGAYLPG